MGTVWQRKDDKWRDEAEGKRKEWGKRVCSLFQMGTVWQRKDDKWRDNEAEGKRKEWGKRVDFGVLITILVELECWTFKSLSGLARCCCCRFDPHSRHFLLFLASLLLFLSSLSNALKFCWMKVPSLVSSSRPYFLVSMVPKVWVWGHVWKMKSS